MYLIYNHLPCLDLLTVPPGLKTGMNFSNKGLILILKLFSTHTCTTPLPSLTYHSVCSQNTTEAKTTKGDVNLLSLLSTFDDIIEPVPEEKERGSGSAEESKLHRTNSLEDLGIKVNSERIGIRSDEYGIKHFPVNV